MARHIFIFGLGYVGAHLARQLSADGWQISGTVRSADKARALSADGWHVFAFADEAEQIAAHLKSATHLISTIAPDETGDPVLAGFGDALASFKGWTGYLSATSIYPAQKDGFVDETVAPAPATDRGRRRLAAEQGWQDACNAEIFRAAGIYGPHRNPFAALREGRAKIIDKDGHLFNRIHQSDISKIIMAAMAKPRANRIINLCDGEPASQAAVIGFAAQLLNIEPPAPTPFADADLSPMARSFYVSFRRLSSSVIAPELGVTLDYPSYREGLKASLEAEEL